MKNIDHNRFERGLQDVQNITMSKEESQKIFSNILKKIEQEPIVSPWYKSYSPIKLVALCLFCIVLAGNVVTTISTYSLPGDITYSFKTQITEPFTLFLTTDVVAKAQEQATLIDTRLREAEILAAQGKLTPSQETRINTLVDTHIDSLSRTLTRMRASEKSEDADNIEISVQAKLNAYPTIIKAFDTHRDTKNPLRHSDPKRIRVNTVVASSSQATSSPFLKKKPEIETRIEHTKTEIKESLNSDTSTFDKTTSEDAGRALNRAERSFKEADIRNNDNKHSEAYTSLLDSQEATEEARALLKAKTDFKRNTKDSNGQRSRKER